MQTARQIYGGRCSPCKLPIGALLDPGGPFSFPRSIPFLVKAGVGILQSATTYMIYQKDNKISIELCAMFLRSKRARSRGYKVSNQFAMQ